MSKFTHEQVEALYQKMASDESITKSIESSPSPLFRANAILKAVLKGLKGDAPVVKKVISHLQEAQELINAEGRKMSASEDEKRVLKCDMRKECESPVGYIDEKGWLYCDFHGKQRAKSMRSRKLTQAELKQLESGKPISKF